MTLGQKREGRVPSQASCGVLGERGAELQSQKSIAVYIAHVLPMVQCTVNAPQPTRHDLSSNSSLHLLDQLSAPRQERGPN